VGQSATPKGDQDDALHVFPWQIQPKVLAKVQAYRQDGMGRSWRCQSRETPRFSKDEILGPAVDSELWVFPDIVAVDGRPPSLLLRVLLFLLQVPAVVLAGPFAVLMAIPALCVAVVMYPIGWLIQQIEKARYEHIARRIRANPKSPYAIRKLLRLTFLMPRCWQPGEIVQLIRVDVRRAFCGRRYVLLLVQDRPIEKRPGCTDVLLADLLPRRRIYMVSVKGREGDADAAADAVGRALGLGTVTKAVAVRNKLVIA